ncbi:MAG: anti-sigma factor antagonist [Rhodospirillales bacterium]|nr:anti-sigma factor antagonist [Rhodospirillales bacterium]
MGCSAARAPRQPRATGTAMIGQPAEIKIQVSLHDGVAVAAIEGDMDLHVSAKLREGLLRAIDDNPAMVVDLTRVTGIDSSGVASLLEVYQRANKRHKKFALAAANEQVLRVMRIARLDKIFVLTATVDEAIAMARRP